MKKLIVSQLSLLLMMSTLFFACSKKDDAPKELLPKLDGLYIYGTNTIAESATDPNARMSLAVLDPSKGPKVSSIDSVYGKFLYIGANSKIKVANVVDEVGTVYGIDSSTPDSSKVVGNVAVKDVVIHGTLKANAAEISVVDEGLYYAFINLNTNLFILMKVRANMIGDATKLQWAKGSFFQPALLTKDSSVFEITGLQLKEASGYRYRFNDGWAVYQDNDVIVLGSLGVFSYGTAWDTGINNIGYLLDNIPQKTSGIFTVRLKYVAATGEWSEKKIKTGDIPADYTNVSLGLEGNAYTYAALDTGKFAGDGTDGFGLKTPSVSGTTFTWTWSNITLFTAREFILLQEAKWGAGLQIDATGATLAGKAFTDGDIVDATAAPFSEQYHNFRVVNGVGLDGKGPTYDITFSINTTGNVRTLTIVRH